MNHVGALNFPFETGHLSISQRRGIVKLVPKKDAKLALIKNWQPLTLLSCDYKIASKAIASRIKSFLPKLISDAQTGFLKAAGLICRLRVAACRSQVPGRGLQVAGCRLNN